MVGAPALAAALAALAPARTIPSPHPPLGDRSSGAAVTAEGEKIAAPPAPREEDHYRIVTIELPAELVLEVSGLALYPDGRPLVATRRGELFLVEGAYAADGRGARFLPFAEGLQEPLGLLVHDGWIWTAQRGELSRLRDVDGDDRADELETVCDAWSVSGNYHEYNFGPRLGPEGDLWITTNKPFGDEPFGRVPWRGFALRITAAGEMVPEVSGLRSPAGLEPSPPAMGGALFYTDNQGEWCGASKLARLVPGSFHGHPHGLFSCDLPPWRHRHPGEPPDGLSMVEVAARMPSFELPAVWFPYDKMGKSPAGMVWDLSDGRFGPFDGQLLVADQHHAAVMRVALEEVNGHWQGAVFPFRSGLQCGAIRLAFGADGSLLVGETSRGWGGRGRATFGLERIEWTGSTPFEMLRVEARPRGFRVSFTAPVDAASIVPAQIAVSSYTYLLHSAYGSDEIDPRVHQVAGAELSADGLGLELELDEPRAGYVHELHLDGLRARDGRPLLHSAAYYTLIERPR